VTRSEKDLVGLVYELLDAHDDTVRLAGALVVDERWQAHLDYLRDLQRVARESLARASRRERGELEEIRIYAAGHPMTERQGRRS
jgi:hypothetical protein